MVTDDSCSVPERQDGDQHHTYYLVRLLRLLAGMAPTMERQHPLRAVWDDRLTVSANGEGE